MTTPQSPGYRPATEDDIEVLVEIIRIAFAPVAEMLGVTEETLPDFPAFTTVERLREYIEKHGVRMFLFCTGAGAVACGGWSPDRTGEPKAWLNRIAVPPDYRGRGYGKGMVQFLEEETRKAGFKRARLGHVTPDTLLHAFYEHLGYETVGSSMSKSGQLEITCMEKDV